MVWLTLLCTMFRLKLRDYSKYCWNHNMSESNILITEAAILDKRSNVWKNSIIMKYCNAAEMPWPTNLVLQIIHYQWKWKLWKMIVPTHRNTCEHNCNMIFFSFFYRIVQAAEFRQYTLEMHNPLSVQFQLRYLNLDISRYWWFPLF